MIECLVLCLGSRSSSDNDDDDHMTITAHYCIEISAVFHKAQEQQILNWTSSPRSGSVYRVEKLL